MMTCKAETATTPSMVVQATTRCSVEPATIKWTVGMEPMK